jgi:hypothetical protein
MSLSNKFASAKYALGMCDICSIRYRLLELKPTTVRGKKTGLLACPTCWDPDPPLNFLDRYIRSDPQALRVARPDTGLADSRTLYPPGNWINGQPPTLLEQEEMQLMKDEEVGR